MSEFNPFPPQLGASALPDPIEEAEFYEQVPTKRLVAFLIDNAITLGIPAAFIATLSAAGMWWLWFLLIPTWFVINGPYRLLTLKEYSATPGMMAMGIEFRDHLGEKFNLRQALIHTCAFGVVAVSGVGLLATSGFVAMTARNQSIPDLVLGSTAINTPE